MTMTRLKISKTLLAVMLTSAVATGSAYAENNAQTTNESAGQKVDSSMNKVGNFMDDSAITAKVKAALVDHDNIKSTDISVKTDQKVVTRVRLHRYPGTSRCGACGFRLGFSAV